MIMRARPFVLAALALLAVPATSQAAECADQKVPYTSTKPLKQADHMGGGALGKVQRTLGEEVTGDRLAGGTGYYVPKGARATVTLDGYEFKVAGGTYFIPQCDLFEPDDMYFRLLEGKVSSKGSRPQANRAYGYVVTPDASFLPRPGKADYTVSRVVTSKKKTTRSSVKSMPGASLMFVKISSLAKAGRQIPCQGGKRITIYANGTYRNG